MRAAYLGPAGSYSSRAAREMCAENDELIPYRDFESVFAAVESGECDAAVVPVENSIEGYVNTILDLFVTSPLHIVEARDFAIDNRVFTTEAHGEVTRIASHPQAYNQCRSTLRALYPDAEFVAASSTSDALAHIDAHTAVVAGSANAREGLVMSGPVSDNSSNTTRFVMLSREDAPRIGRNKIAMVFEADNRPGGLLKLLLILDEYNLNMTSIQSRPHKTELGRYVFFVDVTGDGTDKSVRRALAAMAAATPFFKILGNY